MKRPLRVSAAAALLISSISCGTARPVQQEKSSRPTEAKSEVDSISNHNSFMPEGFIPTHPPVLIPHKRNERAECSQPEANIIQQ